MEFDMKQILVTGGAGYIGSHFLVELVKQGFEPIVFDDFSNSCIQVFDRIKSITKKNIIWVKGDIRDVKNLKSLFEKNKFDAVVHFAGKKSVKESQDFPLDYYSVNVEGTINLLKTMESFNVRNLIFSSTATVYGENKGDPVTEEDPINPINNYGKSKRMVEIILESLAKADSRWNFCVLRYFNPVGAHPSGLIGEDPNGVPANLMPYISQVAVGKRKKLFVYGDDYPTRDGTGARDYIHVVDLAEAHLAALKYLEHKIAFDVFNIGTGSNTTVKEMIDTFSRVNDVKIPYEVVGRREGDSAICYANTEKAKNVLRWSSSHTLEDMCRDSWNWQSKNPSGYSD